MLKMELLFKLLKFLISSELNYTDDFKGNNILMHDINTYECEFFNPQNWSQ